MEQNQVEVKELELAANKNSEAPAYSDVGEEIIATLGANY
jgi:hypothetical protein